GYAIVRGWLDEEVCQQVIEMYDEDQLFRKRIQMERYRFGMGEYKYLKYPLPPIIQNLRKDLYDALHQIANEWNLKLGIDDRYPTRHEEFVTECKKANQNLATPLILKYGPGGFNTMHQDLYGKVFFPLQAVIVLNKPGQDFSGGEFVLMEQIPRAQSKAMVLQPQQGDLLVFTTQYRPRKGQRGYYRVQMKHGVSEIRSGQRHSLGIIFHDAS
ncbi:MAG TPA: 2OG-Fe(II) oxygenase, partial [Puia sp.]|nr:2OG-Fe(II) oxygenase [Puia sp.]